MPIKTTLDKSLASADFVRAKLWLQPVPEAWQRMRDLHRCAIGADPAKASVYTTGLTPWQANGYYHAAVAAALGQIAVIPTPARVQLLKSVVEASAKFRSIEGLESVYASLLSAAAAGGATKDFENALNNLEGLGVPDTLGAGALSSPVFNAQDGSLSFLNQNGFGSLFGHGKGSPSASSFNGLLSDLGISGLTGGSGMRGTGGLGMVRPFGASEASDHFAQCVAAWGFTWATGGAIAGGIAGVAATSETGPGVLVGGAVGAQKGAQYAGAFGTFLGTFVCKDDDDKKTSDTPDKPDTPDNPDGKDGDDGKDDDGADGDDGKDDYGKDGKDDDGKDSSKDDDKSGSKDGTPQPGDAGDAKGGGKLDTVQFGIHGGDPNDQMKDGSSGRVDPSRLGGGDVDPLDTDDGKDRAGTVNVAFLPGSGLVDPIDDARAGAAGPLHGGTPVASVMPTTALASSQIKATSHGFRMEGMPSLDSNGKLVSEGALGGKLISALREDFHLAGGTADTVRERGGVIGTLRDTIRRGPSR